MQRRNPLFLGFLLGIVASLISVASAATYYVAKTGSDLNSGAETQPWLTIQKAANTAVAGDLILVETGWYRERVKTVTGGRATARITFKAMGTVTNEQFDVKHPYITLDGFTLTSTSPAQEAILIRKDANFSHILNNRVLNLASNSFGIYFLTSGGSTYTNAAAFCIVSNNILDNPGYQSITVAGASNLVVNNIIRNGRSADAFRLFGAGHIVRGNVITNWMQDPSFGNHPDLFQTFGPGDAFGMLIEGNFAVNCDCQIGQLEQFSQTVGDWTFRNNVFLNVSSSANVDIPNCKWYNNTFYRVSTHHVLVFSCVAGYPLSKGAAFRGEVYNNAFIECGTEFPGRLGWYSHDPELYDFKADYNFVCTTNFGQMASNGAPGDTWHWYEERGLNGGNPMISGGDSVTRVSDLGLVAGSLLIAAGTNLSAQFTSDFAGALRGSTWDIGAFKYGAAGKRPLPPQALEVLE